MPIRKITPGPWLLQDVTDARGPHAGYLRITNEHGKLVALVPRSAQRDVMEANARLIATAPTMGVAALGMHVLVDALFKEVNWGGSAIQCHTLEALNAAPIANIKALREAGFLA